MCLCGYHASHVFIYLTTEAKSMAKFDRDYWVDILHVIVSLEILRDLFYRVNPKK